jgi:hypothetical protein
MARIVLIILLPLALIGGIAGGLALAYGPFASVPVGYPPSALRPAAKEAYIEMVASAYIAEQDVRRARERIELLDEVNIRLRVSERAREAANADDGRRAFRLANLALVIGVEDAQMEQLARPAMGESKEWRWMEHSLLRCDQLPQSGSQPFLRLRVENVRAIPIPDVTAKLTLYDGAEVTLRTDSAGIAQAPFTGEGVITFADGMTIPVFAPNLQTTCTADTTTLPHGVEVVVRSS